MPTAVSSWDLEVERGPGWLFVRPHSADGEELLDVHTLADEIWSQLERHLNYRVTLELEAVDDVSPALLAQLLKLQRRIHERGGMMRLCGVSPHNCRQLRLRGLSDRIAIYGSREEAVMGSARPRPR